MVHWNALGTAITADGLRALAARSRQMWIVSVWITISQVSLPASAWAAENDLEAIAAPIYRFPDRTTDCPNVRGIQISESGEFLAVVCTPDTLASAIGGAAKADTIYIWNLLSHKHHATVHLASVPFKYGREVQSSRSFRVLDGTTIAFVGSNIIHYDYVNNDVVRVVPVLTTSDKRVRAELEQLAGCPRVLLTPDTFVAQSPKDPLPSLECTLLDIKDGSTAQTLVFPDVSTAKFRNKRLVYAIVPSHSWSLVATNLAFVGAERTIRKRPRRGEFSQESWTERQEMVVVTDGKRNLSEIELVEGVQTVDVLSLSADASYLCIGSVVGKTEDDDPTTPSVIELSLTTAIDIVHLPSGVVHRLGTLQGSNVLGTFAPNPGELLLVGGDRDAGGNAIYSVTTLPDTMEKVVKAELLSLFATLDRLRDAGPKESVSKSRLLQLQRAAEFAIKGSLGPELATRGSEIALVIDELSKQSGQIEESESESQAQDKLNLAKKILAAKGAKAGVKWLEQVIRDFPDTQAATEAKELIESTK